MALELTEQRGELVPAISAPALRRAVEVPFYRPERHALSSAIRRLDQPWATSATISRSREVSGSGWRSRYLGVRTLHGRRGPTL